jgi:hypothetical protein
MQYYYQYILYALRLELIKYILMIDWIRLMLILTKKIIIIKEIRV